jgi:hypothetical protein
MVDDFWTIESRLVFYLGTISRDLGKELSLNEFLGTLAPELRDSRISNLVPDAHEFSEQILSSHTIENVEFSRSNQQTMVKWIAMKSNSKSYTPQNDNQKVINVEPLIQKLSEILVNRRIAQDLLFRIERIVLDALDKILIAPIKGDIKSIRGVNTKVATVIEINSPLSRAWKELSTIINEYSSYESKGEEYFWVILGAATLLAGCTKDESLGEMFGKQRYWSRQPRVSKVMKEIWSEMINYFRRDNHVKKLELTTVLSQELSELMGDDDNWFDAASYWWNW